MPRTQYKLPEGFQWLTSDEEIDQARLEKPDPLPTIYNRATGEFQQVDPAYARQIGIPLGPPRTGGREPATSGDYYPAGADPTQFGMGEPLAQADTRNPNEMSTDNPRVLEGFQWLGADDPAAQAATDPYEKGIASTFGYNDPEDPTGTGAWGDNTDNPNAYGVSLPISTLRDIFGDDDKAYGAIVELLNPSTGQTVRAPIIDKGPGQSVVNRQGPTIDVTEGVRRQLGLSGKDPMEWKVLGHGVPSDNPAFAPGGPLEVFSGGNGDIAKQSGEAQRDSRGGGCYRSQCPYMSHP
jgi:hypothetical protein